MPNSLHELGERPRGLVIVTGPTGSGKSTTLAAMIDEINETRTDHIITIEDPIEFLHQHKQCIVNQREIGPDATELRRGAPRGAPPGPRRDPPRRDARPRDDRDRADRGRDRPPRLRAPCTRRTRPSAVDRLIDVFPAAQQSQIRVQVAATLQGVVTQNLLPTVDGTARVPAVEILIPDDAVRNLIRQGKIEQIYSVMQTGSGKGMQTMEQSLADLVLAGVVDAGPRAVALEPARSSSSSSSSAAGRAARSSRRSRHRLRTAGVRRTRGTRDRWTQDRRVAARGRARRRSTARRGCSRSPRRRSRAGIVSGGEVRDPEALGRGPQALLQGAQAADSGRCASASRTTGSASERSTSPGSRTRSSSRTRCGSAPRRRSRSR